MFSCFKSAVILLSLLLLSGPVLAELKIENAWIQNLPPNVPMRAGYMEITNTGQEAVSIQSVDCEACSSITLHESVMKDGMMSMQHLSFLKIEPSQQVSLAPGGKHLMLEPTKTGESITVNLHLEDGSSHSIVLIVRE